MWISDAQISKIAFHSNVDDQIYSHSKALRARLETANPLKDPGEIAFNETDLSITCSLILYCNNSELAKNRFVACWIVNLTQWRQRPHLFGIFPTKWPHYEAIMVDRSMLFQLQRPNVLHRIHLRVTEEEKHPEWGRDLPSLDQILT